MGSMLSTPITATVIEREGSEHFRAAVASMQGWREEQEDSHVCECEWLGERVAAFAVFDGHGGSKTSSLVKTLFPAFLKNSLAPPFEDNSIKTAFLVLDSQLRDLLENDSSGATCTSAFVEFADGAYNITVANLGDSRTMLIPMSDPTKFLVTEDHKPTNEAEERRIVEAGGFVSQGRVNGNLSLSRAFGDFQYKNSSSLPQADQKVSPQPDVLHWTAKPGDLLLIGCDGLYETMNSEQVRTALMNALEKHGDSDLGVVADAVVRTCLDEGSHDNMTCMVIKLGDGRGHKRDHELVLGNFRAETDKKIIDNYISFAHKYGFNLAADPKCCHKCARLFLQMAACPCKEVHYCSRECQKADWKEHKQTCPTHKSSKQGAAAGAKKTSTKK